MSAQHTPEPWEVDTDGVGTWVIGEWPIAERGKLRQIIFGLDARSPDEYQSHQANARRIVACVNACKDITNEQLEANFIPWVCDENARLRRINKMLVESIKDANLQLGFDNAYNARVILVDALAAAKEE